MDLIWDTWIGSIDVCERLERNDIKHMNSQVLIIIWVLHISGCMSGKKNGSKCCLWGIRALCIGFCACHSLLGRFCGDVYQQSVISGLSVFCVQQLLVMEWNVNFVSTLKGTPKERLLSATPRSAVSVWWQQLTLLLSSRSAETQYPLDRTLLLLFHPVILIFSISVWLD